MKIKAPVYALIVVKDKLLLLHRVEYGVWEAVGGKIEAGEKPIDAIRREIKEEIGIEVEDLSLFTVGSVVYPDGETMQIPIFFLTKLEKLPELRLDDEHDGYRLFSLEEIQNEKNIALSVKCILDDIATLLTRKS